MAQAGGPARESDKLKTLLFSPETARLDAAEAQIERLENRVGDPRSLEASTAEILVEAFRRADPQRDTQFARHDGRSALSDHRAPGLGRRRQFVPRTHRIDQRAP